MATVKPTLFNAEKDIVEEVNVSAEDAERAARDTVFATELMNTVLNEQPQTSRSADRDDENLQCSDDYILMILLMENPSIQGILVMLTLKVKNLKIMEEIFAKKAWCDPIAVASPTGLSRKQTESDNSMGESDSGGSIKSNKTGIATLLGKRLRQKEEHEEQKMKRHKERMEMDEKFLHVLDKLANK